MQAEIWKQRIFTAGGWLILTAVTPLALVWLVPGAWASLSEPVPVLPRIVTPAPVAAATPASTNEEDSLLADWADTVAHLTPAENAALAKHIAVERKNLEREFKIDRTNTLSFIRKHHYNKLQAARLLKALRLFEKLQSQLLAFHITDERASASPSKISFPLFDPSKVSVASRPTHLRQ